MTDDVFLITGATGKTGRRVVRILREAGRTVRAGTRHSEPPFDWDNDATWPAALDGVSSVYVVVPDLGSATTIEPVRAFARLAAQAGVRRAVMLSFPQAGTAGISPVIATENAVRETGLALTVVGARWFNQNFSEDFLLDAVLQGELRMPAGDGREAFVDAEDIAEVAVAALTDDRHEGRSYDVTGPTTITFADVAAELSRATGREIRYTPVSLEEFLAEQKAASFPAEPARELGDMYVEISETTAATHSGDVEAVLGKPARDFRSFATRTAATGVWDARADGTSLRPGITTPLPHAVCGG